MILPGAGLSCTRRRAEQICRDAPQTFHIEFEGQALGPITISVGVAVFPDHGLMPHDVIKAADGALYNAKRGGRNQVVTAETVGNCAPDPADQAPPSSSQVSPLM